MVGGFYLATNISAWPHTNKLPIGPFTFVLKEFQKSVGAMDKAYKKKTKEIAIWGTQDRVSAKPMLLAKWVRDGDYWIDYTNWTTEDALW